MSHGRRNDESRRDFLEQIGFGAGAISLFGAGFLSVAENASAQACAPPGLPAPRKRGGATTGRSVSAAASTLSSAEVQKLRDAYKAMRDLSSSDPSDPRGFAHQANIHCWNCGGIGSAIQVHGSWQFFAWHRAYLYFHERILGKLIGDMEFRLPYWDWDVAFASQAAARVRDARRRANPLWNGTRSWARTTRFPRRTWAGRHGSRADRSRLQRLRRHRHLRGIPEGAPHGPSTSTSAATWAPSERPARTRSSTPITRTWTRSGRTGTRAPPPTTTPRRPRSSTCGSASSTRTRCGARSARHRVLDHESKLRYSYGPSSREDLLLRLLEWIEVQPPRPFQRVLRPRREAARDAGQGGRQPSAGADPLRRPAGAGGQERRVSVYADAEGSRSGPRRRRARPSSAWCPSCSTTRTIAIRPRPNGGRCSTSRSGWRSCSSARRRSSSRSWSGAPGREGPRAAAAGARRALLGRAGRVSHGPSPAGLVLAMLSRREAIRPRRARSNARGRAAARVAAERPRRADARERDDAARNRVQGAGERAQRGRRGRAARRLRRARRRGGRGRLAPPVSYRVDVTRGLRRWGERHPTAKTVTLALSTLDGRSRPIAVSWRVGHAFLKLRSDSPKSAVLAQGAALE